ncbi:hypothetical protein LY78DRAFT_650950 [Colletotrichum sublineola]|uniref:Myb-like domain-containing protein n=1 Tax=Colletotrichum sublineola TaxID=1173701 RepID=A0A066WZ28_COLSU|nr:hypothetical protein LY78DRAFT_650950 [Colletotrichum sublineola]KDN62148.1 hypothetical protein CSUB01_00853 [Colletotrichum sublineola]
MNKNWNDRADKDLFFTILSVKNIGVISGSEWTTIGNHMRTLGYGFTNEGCRQHFQGLRRAQHKAETNGGSPDNPRKLDPTTNPITRRPGPGRGRPKKQPQQPAPMQLPSLPNQPGQLVQPSQPGQPDQPGQLGPGQELQADQPPQPELQPEHQHDHQPDPHQPGPNQPDSHQPESHQLNHQPDHDQSIQNDQSHQQSSVISDDLGALPESLDLPLKEDSLDISLKEDNDDEQDGHDAKRIKLDNPPQDPSLVDEEAVLALAAHSEAPSVDGYASEYPTAGLTGTDPHSFTYNGET